MSSGPRRRRTVVAALRDRIAGLVARQGLVAGDRLPSETALARQFSVSRPALREALKLLEQEGLLLAVHGRGRFVSGRSALAVDRPITRFESVGSMAAACGYRLETALLGRSTIAAPDDTASALRLAPGAPVVRIERLRSHDGRVLIYSADFVPERDLGAGARDLDWGTSVNAALGAIGLEPVMSVARTSATCLPGPVALAHGLGAFGAALLIEETAFTAEGRPVLHSRVYHRGDAFQFSFVRTGERG